MGMKLGEEDYFMARPFGLYLTSLLIFYYFMFYHHLKDSYRKQRTK